MKQEEIIIGLAEMKKDISFIRKCLEGNGHKGIIERIEEVEKFRYLSTGGIIVLSALISYGLIKIV